MYLDLKELQHLAALVGPYGVKIIDREILRFIFSNISTIRVRRRRRRRRHPPHSTL